MTGCAMEVITGKTDPEGKVGTQVEHFEANRELLLDRKLRQHLFETQCHDILNPSETNNDCIASYCTVRHFSVGVRRHFCRLIYGVASNKSN